MSTFTFKFIMNSLFSYFLLANVFFPAFFYKEFSSLSFSQLNFTRTQLKSGVRGVFQKHTAKPKVWKRQTRSPSNELVSEETAARRAQLRKQRVKRNKFAMLMAYSGHGYFGFQRNYGVITVEEDLLKTLLRVGYITEEIFNETRLIKFERASRTDKGVSAVGQVVSLQLPVNSSIEIINEHLPKEIRVFALVKVTRGFNSRTFSNARTYSYVLPTFAFAPFTEDMLATFRLTEEVINFINAVLRMFLGSHCFHNFTSGKFPLDPSAFRTILDFSCGDPFAIDDMEFVVLTVKGRSFMLHQIRKMVALTISIVRGLTTLDLLSKSFQRTIVNIPLAPSVGLLLERVHYERYDKRFGNDGIHTSLNWSSWDKQMNMFKQKFILPRIIEAERRDKSYPF